ncbi:MAG: hypothetical protein ACC742_12850 [Thermoanaerobaculales bacterium]
MSRELAGGGHRWILRPWPETFIMRAVLTLDKGMVERRAEEHATERRGRRYRSWARLLLPFAGMVPAALQRQWGNDWTFPAETATRTSAIAEIAVGLLGTAQLILLDFFLIGEGTLRLIALATGRPVASVFGLLLRPFYRRWLP